MKFRRILRVLIACEESGTLRDMFLDAGHYCCSCDLKPGRGKYTDFHIVGDALEIAYSEPWDMMICHPECRYLAASGFHRTANDPERLELANKALKFAVALFSAPIPRICLENPVGVLNRHPIFPRPQFVQPYQFGDDACKKTGLWLKNLPRLRRDIAKRVHGRLVNGRERWSNQTDSGQNKLGPSSKRSAIRAVTYKGIAKAMVEQWGSLPRLKNYEC